MESGIFLRAYPKLPTVGAAQCEVEHYFHILVGPVQGTLGSLAPRLTSPWEVHRGIYGC